MTTNYPWANNDALYQEMLGFMPNLYFLGNHSEATSEEHCSEEFSRIRRLVCKYNHFDEEGYIRDNDGTSPFDAVRADVEAEIRRRIRLDENMRTLVEFREQLISRITQAVTNHSHRIDTYYKEGNSEEEYETSPIVVTHDSANFNRYGGYEAATLYNLFICNDKLFCTLNGESGEDFEQQITDVQTEGLIAIAQWLEEYGFISEDDFDVIVCEECGSRDIQTQAWVDPNSHRYIDETGIDRDDNWCDGCQTNTYFCSKAEFMERMEAWWGETDFREMERITGFCQDDFSPEDGYQDFVDACSEWWEKMTYDEKRAVFNEHNGD